MYALVVSFGYSFLFYDQRRSFILWLEICDHLVITKYHKIIISFWKRGRETGIHRSSAGRVVHKDIRLECLKRRRAQQLRRTAALQLDALKVAAITAIRVNILTFCTSTEHAFDMSASEMTYIVSSGALNSTHSLTHVRTTNSILLTLWWQRNFECWRK